LAAITGTGGRSAAVGANVTASGVGVAKKHATARSGVVVARQLNDVKLRQRLDVKPRQLGESKPRQLGDSKLRQLGDSKSRQRRMEDHSRCLQNDTDWQQLSPWAGTKRLYVFMRKCYSVYDNHACYCGGGKNGVAW